MHSILSRLSTICVLSYYHKIPWNWMWDWYLCSFFTLISASDTKLNKTPTFLMWSDVAYKYLFFSSLNFPLFMLCQVFHCYGIKRVQYRVEQIRFTVVSVQNTVFFLYYYLLVTVLFSIWTIVKLLLPHAVFYIRQNLGRTSLHPICVMLSSDTVGQTTVGEF